MILLTGGTGFLGSHLLYYLLSNNYEVKALCRETSNKYLTKKIFSWYNPIDSELFSSINWEICDLTNYLEVKNCINNVDGIIHAAAFVSYDPRDKEKLIEGNVTITENLVNAALECNLRRFIHVSSIAALGETKSKDKMITELTKWSEEDGNSGYSFSKYYSEMEVWRGVTEGLNAVVVNPSVILGYGDWSKGSCALFSTIFKGFKYYTLGSSGFVNVEDVCQLIIKLYKNDVLGEQFILSAENKTYQELFTAIAEALNVEAPKKYATPFLTGLAWRLEYLKSKLAFTKPLITKESARTSHKKLLYSNQKQQNLIPHKYISIDETIRSLGQDFLKEKD